MSHLGDRPLRCRCGRGFHRGWRRRVVRYGSWLIGCVNDRRCEATLRTLAGALWWLLTRLSAALLAWLTDREDCTGRPPGPDSTRER
jgi:hypothetical protein